MCPIRSHEIHAFGVSRQCRYRPRFQGSLAGRPRMGRYGVFRRQSHASWHDPIFRKYIIALGLNRQDWATLEIQTSGSHSAILVRCFRSGTALAPMSSRLDGNSDPHFSSRSQKSCTNQYPRKYPCRTGKIRPEDYIDGGQTSSRLEIDASLD